MKEKWQQFDNNKTERKKTPMDFSRVKDFLSISHELDLRDQDKKDIAKDPELYFSTTFNGMLSDYHINVFLKMAYLHIDLPVHDIKAFAMNLKKYDQEKQERDESYSKKEIQALNFGIKYIELYLKKIGEPHNHDIAALNDSMAATAYITNRLVKIKNSLIENSEDQDSTEIPSLDDSIINNVIARSEHGLQRYQAISSREITNSEKDPFQESQIIQQKIKSVEKIQPRLKFFTRIMESSQHINSKQHELIDFIMTESRDWDEFYTTFKNNKEEFSSSPELYTLFLKLDNEKNDRNFESQAFLLIFRSFFNNMILHNHDYRKAQQDTQSFIKEYVNQQRMIRDDAFLRKADINHENIRTSTDILRERLDNPEVKSADLYFVKSYLTALFLVNKSMEVGITFDDLMKSVYIGHNPSASIRKDRATSHDLSSVKFDVASIQLHYYRDTMLPLMLAAYDHHRERLDQLEDSA